ncbi:MAG: caspase family protein [Muribaculaceae bacterium]|nr:caspase family protein [Muribaculaceae bacterium]
MKNKLRIFLSLILLTMVCVAHGRTYLVAVGVNNYSQFGGRVQNLTAAKADAYAVTELYVHKSNAEYMLLCDRNATTGSILNAIRKMARSAGADDRIVFYFSGHGYKNGVVAYNGQVSFADIRKALMQSKSRSKIMIVDACNSGGSRKSSSTSSSAYNAAKKADVMLFLSSRDNENSQELPYKGHGLFTYWMLRGLKGEADTNRDGKVSAKEIFNYVHTGVSKTQRKQHPVMWGNFNGNMSVL